MAELSKMSAEERKALQAELKALEAEEALRKQQQIDTYKELVSDAVEEAFGILKEQSIQLSKAKMNVYQLFDSIKEMKGELFNVKSNGQWSHTFTDKEGKHRITLGTHTLDVYDDTANEGIAMVNDYLNSLSVDNPQAAQAVDICRSLLARDKKGNLKPARIVTLYKHARESGNVKFLEGVEVIMNAYNPTPSKTYIRAEEKNSIGEWISIPLGMTEAE